MEYAIAALFFFAIWHFIYENILRPTMHVSQRNKFFALRDELRALECTRGEGEAEAFQIVHEGVNNSINSVEALDLSLQMRVHNKYTSNAAFRQRIDQRRAMIDDSDNAQLKDIAKRANRLLFEVFVGNSGGWLIYLVPVALCSIFYQRVKASMRELFTLGQADANDMFQGRLVLA